MSLKFPILDIDVNEKVQKRLCGYVEIYRMKMKL